MKYATAVEDRVDYRPTVSTHRGEEEMRQQSKPSS